MLNFSMISCLRILFSEQRGLLKWFVIALPATIIAGGASPAQAVLFSKLINVFTLPPDEASERANFFSLMFFIIAIVVAIGYFAIGFTVNMVSFLLLRVVPHAEASEQLLTNGT